MSDGDTLHDQPHTPVHPDMSAAAAPMPPDDTILAARCPPGWRRDPMTGRPVMPCLGKLLFPCEPHEVPTAHDIAIQCQGIFGGYGLPSATLTADVCFLVQSLLTNAALGKRDHGRSLDLLDDRIVCNAVDNALRLQGTVRIRRVAGGWEEVVE